MKRKTILFILIISFFATLLPVVAQTNDDIIRVRIERPYERITAQSTVRSYIRFYVQFDVLPFMQDGEVFIPLRRVAEALGVETHWDEDARTISHVNHEGFAGSLVVDYDNVLIVHDRAFVQLWHLGESLGLNVYWDSGANTVVLTTPLVRFTPEPAIMVWLSATGGSYHTRNDCGAMVPGNARRVSRRQARADGYTACRNCWR